jgi:ribosome modulation factor
VAIARKSGLSVGTTGKFRDECPNEHWFVTMDHARRAIETWRKE